MSATLPSKVHIISTYRSLLRSGLKAVMYAAPAKHAIREKLRAAFEVPPNGQEPVFNQAAIDNTKQFLDAAAAYTGMEHKIVKNLCAVHAWRTIVKKRRVSPNAPGDAAHARTFYNEYEATIKLLNQSMNLELR